jgi:hypothetical protein
VLTFAAFAAALAWYIWSPLLAIAAIADFDAQPAGLAQLYARDRVRQGFAAQTEPAVDAYPPPLTKAVVLDALSDPRSVRMLVAEPYGDWQFAAWEGLPQRLRTKVSEMDTVTSDPMPAMPRALETTEEWIIDRRGLSEFVARGADRPGSKAYRFVRRGMWWRLEEIDLGTTVR